MGFEVEMSKYGAFIDDIKEFANAKGYETRVVHFETCNPTFEQAKIYLSFTHQIERYAKIGGKCINLNRLND